MRRPLFALMTGLIAVLVILLLAPGIVRAHEKRTIAGKYDVLVGWDKEPPLINQPNAAGIFITQNGQPVTGVEKTLKVDIAFGGNTPKEFDLEASDERPGYYLANLIPTRAGDYIWTFVGTINGDQINEKFESGPDTFDTVGDGSDLDFPQPATDPVVLANQVNAVQSQASLALLVGAVGLVVGIAGLAVGVIAVRRRK